MVQLTNAQRAGRGWRIEQRLGGPVCLKPFLKERLSAGYANSQSRLHFSSMRPAYTACMGFLDQLKSGLQNLSGEIGTSAHVHPRFANLHFPKVTGGLRAIAGTLRIFSRIG